MGKIDISFQPRLMSAPEAAAYLATSQTVLRSLPIPRKVQGARRVYDRLDLDAYAASLSYEGEVDEVQAWDKRISG